MGRPKALLEHRGESFVARAVRVLREGGCDEVWVVAGSEGDAVAGRVAAEAARCGARLVRNPRPDSEQVDSLRLAVGALPADAEAAVFTPVDHPRLPVAAVRAVLDAYRRTAAPLVVPVHEGERGHPTLLAVALFGELLEGELPDGARSLLERHRAELVEVPVEDGGILVDVDTPEELRAALE
jgi:CTP:molybdopterin cytidylyltransferase MocA